MEAIEQFHINPILIAAQIVNFLIILYILKRFLYKPLFETFKKRESLAKETIEKTESARLALEKAHDEEKQIIKKAQITATQIINDAKEQSVEILTQAKAKTKQESEKMIKEAKLQIEMETAKSQTQLNKYVTNLSLELLKKSLSNVFTEKEQSDIVQRTMKEMQKQAN